MTFYIGESGSTYRKFDKLEDFIDAIRELVDTYEQNHEEWFEIQVVEATPLKMVYKVPVVWSAMGYVRVEAVDADAAKEYVKTHLHEFPLPTDGEYLDDNFEVDEEGEPIMVSAYWGE